MNTHGMDNASTHIEEKALKRKAQVQSYGCGKYDHYKRECRSRKRVRDDDKRAKFATGSHEKALYRNPRSNVSNAMVIDSGASCPMMDDGMHFLAPLPLWNPE